MRRKVFFSAGCALLLLSVLGCASTSDPSRGGYLDGQYNLRHGVYQQRVSDKQGQLAETQEAGVELRADNRELGRQADSLDAQEAAYREKLARLRQDVTGLETKLKKVQAQGENQQRQKRNLLKKLSNLKDQIQNAEQQQGPKGGATDADLQSLRSEKERLQNEIIKLTSK
jgi:chromosome segregation ATPase